MEVVSLIIIDPNDAPVFPGSALLKSVGRKCLRHLWELRGKVAALPKLVVAPAVVWEWLTGFNLSRVVLKQTPVALEHLTLLPLAA